ncbi:MAG TPA: dienelactone hydrolase [Aquabacterium sp.]|nr:dienelactone hydrolase [Aquabacterium sp.]
MRSRAWSELGRQAWHLAAAGWLGLTALSAWATVGYTVLPATETAQPVSVFYPASAPAQAESHGPFQFDLAHDAAPQPGNHRLIVISPGSGASPWVYFDLTHLLVSKGYVVAMPEHAGDNDHDHSRVGPLSWQRRPIEVSQAIDRVAADPRFHAEINFAKVGMYGMSAGGHTALTLAGGQWSPSQLKAHCMAHVADDFQSCAGTITRLTGGWMDGLKRTIVRWVDEVKFNDTRWFSHTDARIQAIVAGVPFAADFDPDSLRDPPVPLALISARHDQWLNPAFHSDAIAQACRTCVHLYDVEQGGHGALLSPLPPIRGGVLGDLIADPADFDRAHEVPRINQAIETFFSQRLIGPTP